MYLLIIGSITLTVVSLVIFRKSSSEFSQESIWYSLLAGILFILSILLLYLKGG